jgi:hypothetical protein
MKFNVSNSEEKITFTFECEPNDPMVSVLFDLMSISMVIIPEEPIVDQPEIPVQPLVEPVLAKAPRKRTPKVKTTPADVDFKDPNQLAIPMPDQEQTITQVGDNTATLTIKPPQDIVIPDTVTLKIDINSESDERMAMDIDALKIMIESDKLAAMKFIKDKTGLDLNNAKIYGDNLWNKHLKDS